MRPSILKGTCSAWQSALNDAVLMLFHLPTEKKFSFLNPDELAKMKEEEGRSARKTDLHFFKK